MNDDTEWTALHVVLASDLPDPVLGANVPNGTTWGNWRCDKELLTLEHAQGYEIDLERCTTCAEVLDWLCQLAGKSRSEPLYSEHITLGFIVPATHPAYRLWMEIDDGGNESFYRLPVVAWKVVMDAFERKYTNAEPITEYFEGEVAANSASMVIYNTLPAEEYLRQFDRGYTHAEASAAEVLRDRIVFLKGIAAKRTEKKQSA